MGRDGLGCKIGLVRLLAEDWGTTSIRCGWFIWLRVLEVGS